MKSLLIDPKDKIEVNIFSAKNINKPTEILISNTEEALKSNKDVDIASIKKFSVYFKYPNYGVNADILSKSVTIENGEVKVNPMKLRYTRFVSLIDSWNLLDPEGNEIQLTIDNINKLDPNLAELMSLELEKVIG